VARKKKPVEARFLLCDVIYQDGSRSSNRRISTDDLDPFDRAGSIRALIEQQDRKLEEASGKPRAAIKSVTVH
jgi:hypothetical protein